MSDNDLEERFPEMRPLRSLPSLTTMNGIGLMLYGARDHDPETNTYVKTRCFTLVFVPLLAMEAYRVADAQNGGWYFLGRVPLSRFARTWNWLVLVSVLAVFGGVWWDKHSNSPEYRAGQRLAEADAKAAAGQLGAAAGLYRDVITGPTAHAATARARFKEMLDGPVRQAPPAEAAAVLSVAVQLHQQKRLPADPFAIGTALADQHAAANPGGALALLDAVAPLAPDPAALTARRRPLLERLVTQQPDNPTYATKLALIYEAERQPDKCEALLAKHAARLGNGEGARILGQIYARQGKLEQAHALLLPYAEGRLAELHAAEEHWTETYKRAEAELLARLKKGKEADFPYQRYQQAGRDEKEGLIHEYLDRHLKDDPGLRAAQEAVMRQAGVVPVALDLGIVLLRRGQTLPDAGARGAEMAKAKKTFLAVRGLAGQSSQYRLFLGQVHYWLGEHAEGKKLFDELLTAQKRDADTLLNVGMLLREVGAVAEARALVEEAYNTVADESKKQMAAVQRSLMNTDLDDQILWLRRGNLADPMMKPELAMAEGKRALRDGRDQEAADHLREAVAGYERLPVNAATLNNGALAWFTLFSVTGERGALDKGVAMLEKAVALKAGDSLVLGNMAGSLLEVAVRDLIGPGLDLRLLKRGARLELIQYLYDDRAGRDRFRERGRKHPGLAKAVAYYERALTLAPRRSQSVSELTVVYAYLHDLQAQRALWQRVEGKELDLTDHTRDILDFYAGKKDDKYRKEMAATLDRAVQTVAAARKGPGGATAAVALATLAMQQMGLDVLGVPADADEVVRLSEEAHAAAPSRATRGALIAALFFRGNRTLAKQEPAYAALAARGQRALGPSYVIPVALARDARLRSVVLANADVQRALTLVKDLATAYPDEPSEWSWALLRWSDPEIAARIAAAIRGDKAERLQRHIEEKLSPVNAATAYRVAWALEIEGKPAEANAVLQRYAARGVPLPLEVK